MFLGVLELALLHLGRGVQEELQDQRTIGDEGVLHGGHVPQPGRELRLLHLLFGALVGGPHQAADEEGSATLGRQRPPQRRALVLLRGGLGEHPGVDEPRVHPLVEPVDQVVGRQPVITGDPDDHREVSVAQVVLRIDQPDPQSRNGRLVVLFADLVADFAYLEHPDTVLPRRG